MARGGRRNGTPGHTYPNRKDLAVPQAEFKGQTYGTGVAQRQAQQAMPVQAPSSPAGQPPVFPEGGVKAGSMGDILGPLSADEQGPVTAGAALGPGPGPETLGLVNPMLDATRRDYQALAPYVPTFMFHASRAGASPSYTAWVQRLLAGA